MSAVTQWFNKEDEKPVRNGEYQRLVECGIYLDIWNGHKWLYSSGEYYGEECFEQYSPWRGLAAHAQPSNQSNESE